MSLVDVKVTLDELESLIVQLTMSRNGEKSNELISKVEDKIQYLKNVEEYDALKGFVKSVEELLVFFKTSDTDDKKDKSLLRLLSVVSTEQRSFRHKFALWSEPDEEVF